MTLKHYIIKAAVTVVVMVALLLLYVALMHQFGGVMLRCPVKAVTGFDCPGCGSQRAFWALLAGDWKGVFTSNLILPPFMAYLLALGALWPFARSEKPVFPGARRLYERLTCSTFLLILVTILLAWTLIRNLIEI